MILRVFSKVLKPVLFFLRHEGHTVIVYFNDSLIQGDNFDLCAEAGLLIVQQKC